MMQTVEQKSIPFYYLLELADVEPRRLWKQKQYLPEKRQAKTFNPSFKGGYHGIYRVRLSRSERQFKPIVYEPIRRDFVTYA